MRRRPPAPGDEETDKAHREGESRRQPMVTGDKLDHMHRINGPTSYAPTGLVTGPCPGFPTAGGPIASNVVSFAVAAMTAGGESGGIRRA